MTTLEYMEKQLKHHVINLERETKRNAPKEQIENIALKVGYYNQAIIALRLFNHMMGKEGDD